MNAIKRTYQNTCNTKLINDEERKMKAYRVVVINKEKKNSSPKTKYQNLKDFINRRHRNEVYLLVN